MFDEVILILMRDKFSGHILQSEAIILAAGEQIYFKRPNYTKKERLNLPFLAFL